MNRRFQIARQLQVQRRGLGVVGAQGLEVVHGWLSETYVGIVARCAGKLIPLEYHVNAVLDRRRVKTP
ncbi:hypothetical protein D3C86_2003260 [compost metagenome]